MVFYLGFIGCVNVNRGVDSILGWSFCMSGVREVVNCGVFFRKNGDFCEVKVSDGGSEGWKVSLDWGRIRGNV